MATKEDTRNLMIKLPPDMHYKLKVACVTDRTTIQELVAGLIFIHLKERENENNS